MGTEQRSFRLRYLHPSFLSVLGPRTMHTPLRVSIWVCLTPPPWIQDALHHHHTVHRFRCHRTDLQHVTTHIRLEYTNCATWLNSFRMGWLNRLTRPFLNGSRPSFCAFWHASLPLIGGPCLIMHRTTSRWWHNTITSCYKLLPFRNLWGFGFEASPLSLRYGRSA
jgi:hypothetical protein